MKIGLVDVDGHNFPNYALMRIAGYHKAKGDYVEMASPLFGDYDLVYQSKIFTFTSDCDIPWNCEVIKGGTGYEISSRLPKEIEDFTDIDYSIYPQHKFSIQFYSRGCIRKCPFCLVSKKEGYIHPVEPTRLNPDGKWIAVMDNNFFANPEWRKAYDDLQRTGQPVTLFGVDLRIMDDEQAWHLNRMKIRNTIHIAWDVPNIDLTDRLKAMTRHIKPYKISCYVLVGFNSTIEQDLFHLRRLKELEITPFVMPYRDYENKSKPSQYQKDLARWANRPMYFKKSDFLNFEPRKGFKCKKYLENVR